MAGLISAEVNPKIAALESLSMSMLSELQNVHDNFSTEDWEVRLQDVAKDYGLEYKGVTA